MLSMFMFSHRNSLPSVAGRALALAGVASLLSGCVTLGSESIVVGRTPVNEAVATTARQQTLMNIVRVYHNEAPVILDIVETDEGVSTTASGTGAVTAIGAAAGRAGSASATLGASDGITNRYIPLQGQALISQLSSQITVETINALYDSDWPLQSILEFSFDRISPSKDDFRLAEDLLTFLDAKNAISLATAKSGFSKEQPASRALKIGSVTINAQQPPSGGGDTLNVYREPKSHYENPKLDQTAIENAWKRLYDLYDKTQPDYAGHLAKGSGAASNIIELRNSPRTRFDKNDKNAFMTDFIGPIARTRTAIGILKYLVTQPKIAFVSPAEYLSIVHSSWNTREYFSRCPAADAYILDPQSQVGVQSGDPEIYYPLNLISEFVDNQYHIRSFIDTLNINCAYSYFLVLGKNVNMRDFSIGLNALKRNILIIKSSQPPESSFVIWKDEGYYFYIMPDDRISQRNLLLVSQFLTIQATSTPSPSLTTISPSGR